MLKKAADAHAFLTRTANHSVTPSRRGHGGSNSPDISYTLDSVVAGVLEETELSQRKQANQLKYQQLTKQLQDINLYLTETRPAQEYYEWVRKRKEVQARLTEVHAEAAKLKRLRSGRNRLLKSGQLGNFADIFYVVAKRALPNEVLNQLMQATDDVRKEMRRQVKLKGNNR